MADGVRFEVEGLRKTLRAMESAGVAAGDLKDLMGAIGQTVLAAARPRVPVRSGALEASLRAGRAKTKAVVRAGGARVPYAGVIHYGWPAHHIAPQPFLTDALAAEQRQVFSQLEEGLSELLRKKHLK